MNAQEKIKAQEQIQKMYGIIENAVPKRLFTELKHVPPHLSRVKENEIMRGQILGQSGRGIWSESKCFYEIGIGFYRDHPDVSGAIGFVSFPNQEICGGPRISGVCKLQPAILAILEELRQGDGRPRGKFEVTDPHAKGNQGAFRFYRDSEFPMLQAAADLAVLISTTFEVLNRLVK